MIRRLVARLPKPLRDRLRAARRSVRRRRFEAAQRRHPVNLDAAAVAAALADAGVEPGDTCFVQAAMSSFGAFDDGADTVIAGFRRAVGEDGLLAMPAFSLDASMQSYLERGEHFDARSTPSLMGRVSETFRRLPETHRSTHPTHSVSAAGPGAEDLVAGHELAPTPFGVGTPFTRLGERGGWQVFFGCGTAPMTLYHAFECTRRPPFPLPVFSERVFEVECVDENGRGLRMRTLAHDPDFVIGRIDSNPEIQRRFRTAILDGGGRAVELGRGEILAIRISDLYATFERLLERGETIYDRPLDPATSELSPQARILGRGADGVAA
ncbi:AAC(3) family N-acetyltransferase [Thermoleophilia bacterium SCSIO 60948]|nr:AAC(3) family N-acetyltransferase [Thermoleophilia bacterium SCSIO 60948]